MKKKILIIVESYLPGYKGGGHGRSISNLVDFYKDEFDFYIFTSDRDLGDKIPYPNINNKDWFTVNGALVKYNNPVKLWLSFKKIVDNEKIDLIYTCGFFSNYTFRLMIDRKLNLIKIPLIIAPMGQFGQGALKYKKLIKTFLLKFSKLAGLMENLYWSASTSIEKEQIENYINTHEIYINEDIPIELKLDKNVLNNKQDNSLKLLFLSRIHPVKNLDYCLKVLGNVKGKVLFDVFGPIEDQNYWQRCLELVNNLPQNVIFDYKGEVHPTAVKDVFLAHDSYFLPTQGENFGHTIIESLSSACVPIISTNTPWSDITNFNCGYAHDLLDPGEFTKTIEYLIDLSNSDFSVLRNNCIEYYTKFYKNLKLNKQFSININSIININKT